MNLLVKNTLIPSVLAAFLAAAALPALAQETASLEAIERARDLQIQKVDDGSVYLARTSLQTSTCIETASGPLQFVVPYRVAIEVTDDHTHLERLGFLESIEDHLQLNVDDLVVDRNGIAYAIAGKGDVYLAQYASLNSALATSDSGIDVKITVEGHAVPAVECGKIDTMQKYVVEDQKFQRLLGMQPAVPKVNA